MIINFIQTKYTIKDPGIYHKVNYQPTCSSKKGVRVSLYLFIIAIMTYGVILRM